MWYWTQGSVVGAALHPVALANDEVLGGAVAWSLLIVGGLDPDPSSAAAASPPAHWFSEESDYFILWSLASNLLDDSHNRTTLLHSKL